VPDRTPAELGRLVDRLASDVRELEAGLRDVTGSVEAHDAALYGDARLGTVGLVADVAWARQVRLIIKSAAAIIGVAGVGWVVIAVQWIIRMLQTVEGIGP
jgi:hypothetical protein